MTNEHWQQVESLYHSALELNPEARASFLDNACAADPKLRTEVESLLEFNSRTRTFIEAPAIDVAARLLAYNGSDRAGRTFGPYRLIRLLGAGGMGEVYLAHDQRLERKVAIKLLPPAPAILPDYLMRFRNEARAASALNHPNIVTIHEIGEIEGEHFIAAEYVEGNTVRERMANGPVPVREAVRIAVQVASALAAAHQAGIVHRDIKPENLMLRPDGYVKVLDFGLAKLCGSAVRSSPSIRTAATQAGIVVGTVQYMSPEQALGVASGPPSDVFSLGVVLHEMIAGRVPIGDGSPREQIAALVAPEPLPLMLYASVPPELQRIIAKMLARDPEQRYRMAGELFTELEAFERGLALESQLEQWASSRTVSPTTPASAGTQVLLEPIGGAVPLESAFYISRAADDEFYAALARQDGIVLVKGARQVGKTSLLARGLEQARQRGARVVLTDLQSLNEASLETPEKFLRMLAEVIAEQLDLEASPAETWQSNLSPGINLERYLRRAVLARSPGGIVWGLDEVDRVFNLPFASEVFGLFRSWHNKRALDPSGPWRRLTLAIAYASEAHLFITDLNQSPFNVGTRLTLEDFTFDEVEELNRRHGSPLRDQVECMRFVRLVGGNPYLVRGGLYEIVAHGLDFAALDARADRDDGPFGVHLRRMLFALSQDRAVCDAVRSLLRGKTSLNSAVFYRLRSAGVISGDAPLSAQPRCQLYSRYLSRHLL